MSQGTAVVSAVTSDAHTWNLVLLELVLAENGYDVVNLGPCVPDDLLVERCRAVRPAVVVLSTVNGHGYHDCRQVAAKLRGCAELTETLLVVGGKLGITGELGEERVSALRAAGFDAVFSDDSTVEELSLLLDRSREGSAAKR